MFPGSAVVARAVAQLFGSEDGSDCSIIFYVEGREEDGDEGGDSVDGAAEGARKVRKVERAIGDPLPGHQFVLRCISERFRAKIDRWDGAGPKDAGPAAPSAPGRLELRVSLNSEEEEPSARAAIGVGYTGRVQAGSMREALLVRRQGGYLQIDDCAAACDKFIADRLQQSENSSTSTSGAAGAGDGQGMASPQQPPVLEFFSSSDLFPDPTEDASFAAVLARTKQALVRRFPDTLAVLNISEHMAEFLALPAVAVEALLESDDFGTDAEATVLLLLAYWVKNNHEKTDSGTRERLCRLVRLVQLDRSHLTFILPTLAADYESGAANSPAAWFPIHATEAAFVASCSFLNHLADLPGTSASTEREQMMHVGGERYGVASLASPWYNRTARPQCVPARGLTYDWHVSEEELKQVLAGLQLGEVYNLCGEFETGKWWGICANGIRWQPSIRSVCGESVADVYLESSMPGAYSVTGSSFSSELNDRVGVASIIAEVRVHCWAAPALAGGARVRQDAYVLTFGADEYFRIGEDWGIDAALNLRQPEGWAEYLHGGNITASLTLYSKLGLRPAVAAADD